MKPTGFNWDTWTNELTIRQGEQFLDANPAHPVLAEPEFEVTLRQEQWVDAVLVALDALRGKLDESKQRYLVAPHNATPEQVGAAVTELLHQYGLRSH